jgi:DNA-directed RNA polymerase subunit RPC12/RpoP
MTESFRCPSCSAPLEFEGKPVQKCRFCGSNVIVPANVLQSSPSFGGVGSMDFGDLSALTGKALKIAEIQGLIQSGSKIHAIKVFREAFGVGLKEAKDAVEAMEEGRSVDISGMQIRSTNVHPHIQGDAQDHKVLKKVGYAVGAPSLLSFVITFAIVAAAIVGVFLIVYFTLGKPVEETSAPFSAPPAAPVSQEREPVEASIARELLKFGGEGTGAGKFKDNRTIAVDADGKIYSGDFSGGRIQIFDADGNFLSQILNNTNRSVDALAVDRKGNLFVLQGYDVYRLNKETGEELGKQRVDFASDMALGLDGKVYVSGRRGGVTVLSAELQKLKSIVPGKDLGLDYIEQIALDGTGNLFLLDARSLAVFKLAPDGKLLTRFGGRGSGSPGDMPEAMFSGMVTDLAVDSQGRLYVSQVSRVSVFDAGGNFLNDFQATQAFGMALNERDELFAAARPFVVKYKLNL